MFPKHFPPNCPPDKSISPDGNSLYYRLAGLPVTEADLLSHYEQCHPNSDNCGGRSVSMWTNTGHLERLKETYPESPKFKGKEIVGFRPPSNCGLMEIGKSKRKENCGQHVHLWIFQHIDKTILLNFFETL